MLWRVILDPGTIDAGHTSSFCPLLLENTYIKERTIETEAVAELLGNVDLWRKVSSRNGLSVFEWLFIRALSAGWPRKTTNPVKTASGLPSFPQVIHSRFCGR
jgi:hypothetical protein